MDVITAFASLDRQLALDPAERQAAEACHKELSNRLRIAGVIGAAFLQGSFARKTMRRPLKDIDKILVLHPDLEPLRNDPRGPDLAMDRIEEAVSSCYPKATFVRTRHALKATFPDRSFTFDMVPAFESDGADDDDVLIANRDTGDWQRSNTRTLLRVVTERNQQCDGQFIHQVRMCKEVVHRGIGDDFPGLHTESLAFAAISEPWAHDEACTRMFHTASTSLLVGQYTDPTGRDAISTRLPSDVRWRAQAAFASAAAQADEARRLILAGDQGAAIAIWSALFGECFPTASRQTVEDAFAASIGGSITSAGYVSSTAAGRQRSAPTRAWRPVRSSR